VADLGRLVVRGATFTLSVAGEQLDDRSWTDRLDDDAGSGAAILAAVVESPK